MALKMMNHLYKTTLEITQNDRPKKSQTRLGILKKARHDLQKHAARLPSPMT